MALTNSLFRSFFAAKNWPVPADGTVFGVGIRGAKLLDADSIEVIPNTPRGFQDDLLGWAGAAWYLAEGTVEPGAVPAPNPAGMAYRADGEHLFHPGLHRRHRAFVQHGGARIWRDRDADATRDPTEEIHVEVGNGLNWHAGPLTDIIGKSSYGCLNTRGGYASAAWKRTYDIGKKAVAAGDTKSKGVLAVYLLSADELVRFSNA